MSKGFVILPRAIIDWQWYMHKTVWPVFTHLLINANHKDSSMNGRIIKRGQIVIGTDKLAEKCNLSRQQTRSALRNLKQTNEITTKATNKYTLVTLVRYNELQKYAKQLTTKTTCKKTHKQPTNNQQITTNNNENNENNTFSSYAGHSHFSMTYGWSPSEQLKEMARFRGFHDIEKWNTDEALKEFVLYWVTQQVEKTSASWNRIYLENLVRKKNHQLSSGGENESNAESTNWFDHDGL